LPIDIFGIFILRSGLKKGINGWKWTTIPARPVVAQERRCIINIIKLLVARMCKAI
jgi:hypothetical protein